MFLKIKLLLLARMGDIFITVGDLFACGKATPGSPARSGGTTSMQCRAPRGL